MGHHSSPIPRREHPFFTLVPHKWIVRNENEKTVVRLLGIGNHKLSLALRMLMCHDKV